MSVILLGGILTWKPHVQKSLEGYSPWGPKEPNMTEPLTHCLWSIWFLIVKLHTYKHLVGSHSLKWLIKYYSWSKGVLREPWRLHQWGCSEKGCLLCNMGLLSQGGLTSALSPHLGAQPTPETTASCHCVACCKDHPQWRGTPTAPRQAQGLLAYILLMRLELA